MPLTPFPRQPFPVSPRSTFAPFLQQTCYSAVQPLANLCTLPYFPQAAAASGGSGAAEASALPQGGVTVATGRSSMMRYMVAKRRKGAAAGGIDVD